MIPKDRWFYFVGGKSASSIEQLKDVLETIDDPEFVFHVNSGKNDFANWVEGVLKKDQLSRDMRRVQERKDMILEIEKHLEQEKGVLKEPFDADKYYLPADFATEVMQPAKDLRLPMFETPHHEIIKEHKLSHEELKKVAHEAERELHLHDNHHKHHEKHVHSPEPLISQAPPAIGVPKKNESKFIVKEFIYGFIVGLIFGLIMLGVIFNINCPVI